MSEFDPGDLEKPPEEVMELSFGGEILHAHRHNTTLYTFLGDLAVYDHIFVVREVEENRIMGSFIWQTDEIYEDMKKRLRYLEWPQVLNMNKVSTADVTAFEQRHYKDIRESPIFPLDWLGGYE